MRLSRGKGLAYWLRLVPQCRANRRWSWTSWERRVDVVHSDDLLDFLGALGRRLAGAATVQRVRMFPPAGILGRLIRALVARLNTLVFCVSKAICHAMGRPSNGMVYSDSMDPAGSGTRGGGWRCASPGTRGHAEAAAGGGSWVGWSLEGPALLIEAAPRILAGTRMLCSGSWR